MKRREKRLLLLVAVAAMAAAIGWALWPEPDLLHRAKAVAKTDGWFRGKRFNTSIGMHWLSDEEVLFDRFEGKDKDEHVIYRLNLETGAETRMSGLTRSREEFGGEVTDSQVVSPDGKGFLCSDRWGSCMLAEVNGARKWTYPSQDTECYRSLVWFADSRGWAEIYCLNGECHKLVLHDVSIPVLSTNVQVGQRAPLLAGVQRISTGGGAMSVLRPDEEAAGDHGIEVYRFPLASQSPPKPVASLVLPWDSDDFHFEMSPHGDRIAGW